MEWLWSKIENFGKVFFSYIRALVRLVIWTFVFFFAGLQRTLFTRSEIVLVEFRTLPLRCDLEEADQKLAFVDKLCLENPDLVDALEEENMANSFSDEEEDDEDGDI